MDLLQIVVLAIVQGITEFLPISSDGHLVVANALLEAAGRPPAPDVLEVTIALHMGTLCAVLVYYRREIARLLTSDRRVIPLLLVATIPAGIVGVVMKKVLPESMTDSILESVLLAGFMFPVTAAALLFATWRRGRQDIDYPDLRWWQAGLIGLAQATAILPGVSRSGTTIATGLALGMRRDAVATFSFLMSIPVIAGAGLLEGIDVYQAGGTSVPVTTLLIGVFVSFAVGLVALALLIRFVKAGKLSVFAWYLIPLGIAVVAWQLGWPT